MKLELPPDMVLVYGERKYRMPYWHLVPPLTDEETDELAASIKDQGIHTDVVVNATNLADLFDVVDGHHRLLVAHALGVADAAVPVKIVELSYDAAEVRAVSANLTRRQVTDDSRVAIVRTLRTRGWSYRRINQATGFAVNTIIKITAADPKPETVTDSQGREQPATKPKREPAPEPAPEETSVDVGPVADEHVAKDDESAPATPETKEAQQAAAKKLGLELMSKLAKVLGRLGLAEKAKKLTMQQVLDALNAV